MQTVVQWKEVYRDEEGEEHVRNRKYDWDAEAREFIDYEDHKPTLRLPVKLLADKDLSAVKSFEARKIVKFAQKEVNNGDYDNKFKPY